MSKKSTGNKRIIFNVISLVVAAINVFHGEILNNESVVAITTIGNVLLNLIGKRKDHA